MKKKWFLKKMPLHLIIAKSCTDISDPEIVNLMFYSFPIDKISLWKSNFREDISKKIKLNNYNNDFKQHFEHRARLDFNAIVKNANQSIDWINSVWAIL